MLQWEVQSCVWIYIFVGSCFWVGNCQQIDATTTVVTHGNMNGLHTMTDALSYTPPKVWKWESKNGGFFATINRPIAGPTHDKKLPVGKHPLQLYSLATPNGVKVTVMLEELLALGFKGAEYDAYLMDRAENRLIHSALKSVASYTNVNKSKKLSQDLLFAFDEVPLSANYKNDFSSVKLQRGIQHYDVPLSWARLILEGYSPQSMLGDNNAYSLLFPMEAVFENFVAKYLKQRVTNPQKLSSQVQSKSLVTYGDKSYFRLKPDLYLKGFIGMDTVLDTKWKLINQNKSSGSDKFDLSQSDFYQMLAYGYKYLDGKGTLVLIYPKTSDFERPFAHPFRFDKNEKLSLYVLPFDLAPNVRERITWAPLSISEERKLGNLTPSN